MKYYITADTHGDREWLRRFDEISLKPGDMIIILGDFGFIWDGSLEENKYLDELQFYLEEKQVMLLFLDGNHENHAILNAMEVVKWNNGKVHKIRESVIHLMRGQVFKFIGEKGDNLSIFTMGGGYSIDQGRRVKNISYWDAELPSLSEYEEAIRNLQDVDFNVDYVLSHTGPQETISYFSPKKSKGEQELNRFLQVVRDTVKPKCMYYGHLHMSTKLTDNETVLYKKVMNLETNEYV